MIFDGNDSLADPHLTDNEQGAFRRSSLMRAIDDLLFDLEDLNVRGIDRVPATLRERAARLFGLLAAPGVGTLRPCNRVAPMVHMLARAQAGLNGNLTLDALDDQGALNCA